MQAANHGTQEQGIHDKMQAKLHKCAEANSKACCCMRNISKLCVCYAALPAAAARSQLLVKHPRMAPTASQHHLLLLVHYVVLDEEGSQEQWPDGCKDSSGDN